MRGLKILSKKTESRATNETIEASNRQFQKIVRYSLLMGILLVSGFIIYYVVTPEEGYVGFGILNSDEKAEDYPTTARVNESIKFYVTVDNYLNDDFTFKLIILKGDNETDLSSKGSKHAHKCFTTDKEKLKPEEEWMSDRLSISFEKNGTGQSLIVELWRYNEDNSREFWDILWLRIDVRD